MGCFLTTTRRDLGQIKSRMRSGGGRSRWTPKPNPYMANFLALSSINPILGNIYIQKESGRVYHESGKIGERMAEKILEQEMAIKITQRTNAQGPDLGGFTRGLSEVSVEVKTSRRDEPFEKLLGTGHGHKQCSDGWLKHHGVDPSNTRILGVHIDPIKETVSIYRRVDGDAEIWKCLMRNAPLSKYNFK